MPTTVRSTCGSRLHQLSRDDWDLDRQLARLTRWIRRNADRLTGRSLIADIGFSDRARPSAVACGYTIPIACLRVCVAHAVTLWLSSSGEAFDAAVEAAVVSRPRSGTEPSIAGQRHRPITTAAADGIAPPPTAPRRSGSS